MRRVTMSCIVAAVCMSSVWAVEPANRQSNAQVKAVLDYFCSLSGQTGNRIVSGQFTDFGNSSNLKIMERIHASTGQWPGLLGADYTDFLDPEHVQGYDEIVALNKPFGFSEYGPHGPSNPPGDYDYRRFLAGVKEHFPRTCYFMCWNARWSLATNQNVKEMLDDPAVVNRDELPRALFASETVAVSGPPVEGNWRLVFEDAFDSDTLDASKWIPSYYECDWIKVYQKN